MYHIWCIKYFLIYTMEAQSNFKTVSISGEGAVDVRGFGLKSQKKIKEILRNSLQELGSMKASIMVQVQLERDGNHATAMLRSKSLVVLESTNLSSALGKALEAIMESLANYTRQGSGWSVEEVESIDISTARYILMKGGSYKPLPAWIERKKAIVNVKNTDDRCFIVGNKVCFISSRAGSQQMHEIPNR